MPEVRTFVRFRGVQVPVKLILFRWASANFCDGALPNWFVLCDLQILSGIFYHPEQPETQSVFLLRIVFGIEAGPPPPWFELFGQFLLFLHHGIEEAERHPLWKLHKNSKEKLVKCATEDARLYRVSLQSCTQYRPPSKFNHTRDIRFNFLTAWNISMKHGTLVHHAHVCPGTFIF